MRKAKLFSHEKVLPRMSWSARNLYNTIARSTVPFHANQISFTKTSLTMYQQRWLSKRVLRSYHGDWIPETRFKRWFLPKELPRFQPPQVAPSVAASRSGPRRGGAFDNALKKRHSPVMTSVDQPSDSLSTVTSHVASAEMDPMPTASLFMVDVERRLDVAVFRCCFARSAYESRGLVVTGKVKLNGVKCINPNQLLQPGDMISVEPKAVPMLSEQLAKAFKKSMASDAVAKGPSRAESEPKEEGGISAAEAKADESSASEAKTDEPAEEATKTDESTEEATATNDQADDKAASAPESNKDKSKSNIGMVKDKVLPPGVLPFTLPPFAAPFLFIPPYLEVSFMTCSAIYVRHPTIVPHAVTDENGASKWAFRTDLPSPYPAGGEVFTMAWEHYTRNAPRVRADERRLKHEARVGRNGFISQRARDLKRRRSAISRGWGRDKQATTWREQLIAARSHAMRTNKLHA